MKLRHSLNGAAAIGEVPVEALTSSDPVMRCFARGAASGFPAAFVSWISDELNNRRTEPADVLYALMDLQVQFLSSIAFSIAPDKDGAFLTNIYLEFVEKKMPPHFAAMARMAAEEEKRP